MEKIKLTAEQQAEMYEEFETTRVLGAVDDVDAVRSIFSDDCSGAKGFIPFPPEIREKLLKLHSIAMEVINGEFATGTDRGMFELAWDIEDEVSDAIESLEQIQKVLRDLTDLVPDEDGWEEDEGEGSIEY